jgi:AcrR family transcriptional regulator
MRERLGKADWIRHGLRTLAAEGPGALKVGPMAAGLKVSRGSFYWHFQDIGDFRAQLLRSWEENATDRIIQDLDAEPGGPGRLGRFLVQAFRGRRRLDRAMRAWGAEDPEVATVVAGADARRIGRVARLLEEAGVATEAAAHRAAFLYWAYLGQAAVMDARHTAIPAAALAEIADLLET